MSLPFGLTEDALDAAMTEPNPESLGAATRMRTLFGVDAAIAALQQAVLRRQAIGKFGDAASGMLFTRNGLEQATRPAIAAHHAARLVAAGATRVVDLGCGIGADALAFANAGLEVIAVEIDADTAAVAAANLGGRAPVINVDAEHFISLHPGTISSETDAVFLDPARRNARGRVWQVGNFSPSWSLVTELLNGRRIAGAKLGPALPHTLIPQACEAEWITHQTSTLEVGLWAGPGVPPGRRSALVWPDSTMVVRSCEPLPVAPLGRYLYEPDGAVIRAGGIAQLGESLGAWLLDSHLAYLSADHLKPTPFATAFAVREQLPYGVKPLRSWVAAHRVGTIEIKKRGVEIDPAALRRRLRPEGPNHATLIISRTPTGAVVAVAERVAKTGQETSSR